MTFSFESLIALLTLTTLEVVLGIDNIIFISIISWVMGLTRPWFEVFHHEVSGRDFILMLGGFFLLAKSTFEIHERLHLFRHGLFRGAFLDGLYRCHGASASKGGEGLFRVIARLFFPVTDYRIALKWVFSE